MNNFNLIHSIRFFNLNVLDDQNNTRPFIGAILFGKESRCEILKVIPPMPTMHLAMSDIEIQLKKPLAQKIIFHHKTHDEIMTDLSLYCENGFPLPIVFDPSIARVENMTPFQYAVFRESCKIPHGETHPYSWLAHRIKKISNNRPAARAVGQALRNNPFPLLIPCHRIVKKSGEIGGFMGADTTESWQIGLKRALLDLENLYRQPDFFSNKVIFSSLIA